MSQTAQNIVFCDTTDTGQLSYFNLRDSFFIRVHWDFEKVQLSRQTTHELDSIIVKIKSSSINQVIVYYWDYDYECSSAYYYRKRSEFLYDYINKDVLIDRMYVNHYYVDCEESSGIPNETLSRTLLICITNPSH